MVERRVSVRIAAVGGEQVKSELTGIGQTGKTAMGGIATSAQQAAQATARFERTIGAASGKMTQQAMIARNLAFQANQIGQMYAVSGNLMRSATIQLPDIMASFGSLPLILLGGATAMAAAFIPALISGQAETKEMKDQIDELSGAMSAFKSASSEANTGIGDLRKDFGEYALQARAVLEIQRQMAAIQADRSLTDTVAQIGQMFGALERVNAEGGFIPTWLKPVAEEFGNLNPDTVAEIADQLGLSKEAAIGLANEFVVLRDADGPVEQAAAIERIKTGLIEAVGGAENLTEEGVRVLEYLTQSQLAALKLAAVDIATGIGKGADEGERMRDALIGAAAVNFARDNAVYSGRGGDPRQFMDAARFNPSQDVIDAANEMLTGKDTTRAARSAAREAAREAKRMWEETRTAAERYRIEVDRLNELHRTGAIDAETYARKMEQLKAEYTDAGKFAADVSDTLRGGLDGLFDTIFEGGEKAIEVVRDLGEELARMAAKRAIFDLLAAIFPGTFGAGGYVPLVASANGNVFSGGRVQAFATGGVVTGPTLFPMAKGAGLMGEAGPEAILPLTRIGGKLGVAAAGGGTVVQINDMRRGGDRIETSRQRGPDGREMVVVTVRDEMARGGFDGAARRWGVGPNGVKR